MTENQTIVIVRHHHGDLDDIASVHLAASGFTVEHSYPFEESGPGYGLPQISTRKEINGAIFMGGAQNVTELGELPYLQREVEWIQSCIDKEIPVIGICLGAQLLAHALGGTVATHADGLCEFGYETIYPVDSGNNSWIDKPYKMVQAHFQGFTVPPNCAELATGTRFAHQAFHFQERAFGFQFHPEVSQTMFSEWQRADWAHVFYNATGAQPRDEASRDNEHYNAIQKEWFCSVLDRIFIAR